MIKKSAFLLFITCFLTSPLLALSPLQSAIVIDVTSNKVLYQQKANALTYPASLTKMMTLVLLFDALNTKRVTMSTRLRVSKHAARQVPSKLGLKAGDTLSVKEALMGLITKSANDAAVVIAEKLGGTEGVFARMMTLRARSLGMHSTTFKNASGLPHKNQRTTARDMALLSAALIKNYKKYYPLFKSKSFVFKGKTYKNHNKLLEKVPGVDGIKTGFINASGFNLAASCLRHNHRIVAVVMGGRTGYSRDALMTQLINTSYQRFEPKTMDELVALMTTVPLVPSKEPVLKPAVYKDNGNWMIHMGSFKTIKQAEKAAAVGYMNLAATYRAHVKISKHPKKRYGSYLNGFTKKEARHACAILTRVKTSCQVIAPNKAPRSYVAVDQSV